ncbi:MAG: primosomal protein N' [Candidatus Velthaea sp.]
MPLTRVVEVVPQLPTARFDRSLTYRIPAGVEDIEIGDVLRVPLGVRDVLAFAVSGTHVVAETAKLRDVVDRMPVARAFDANGLALAQWMADAYVSSLREALGAVLLSGALPRAVDRFVPAPARPEPQAVRTVPERLIRFIWEDFPQGFVLAAFLRHPEARRIGDRRALLAHLGALTRARALERRRTFSDARTHAQHVRFLHAGSVPIAGKKAEALVRFVRDRGDVRRSEAVLAGYSEAVIRRALAAGALRETQRTVIAARDGRSRLPPFDPNAEQSAAIAQIAALLGAGRFGEALLQGITGSGKTYVYLAAIAALIARGGRAIVLVPEISLTPQTARRFEDAFGERVAVVHSALSERERYDAWQSAARGDIDIVVGARSAIFAPLPDVRLVVVDEAHDPSYKQDSVPRYHAVEVARERMRRAGGVVVLGSATPALEDYARARAGRFPLLRLRERATAQALPQTRIVDMSSEFDAGARRLFSTPLLEAIGERLRRGEKTVLFVNRRGTARFVLCRACGFVPQCRRCSVALTVHRAESIMRCHYCDAQEPVPAVCMKCGADVREYGAGTERVASDAANLFPHARIVRMDSDTTTRIGDHARLLDRFGDAGDILVGTQMVAKGLDFPEVTLVGAVAADLDLHAADFRAAERTFALITQVCGRSGRAGAGEAIVQTYAPEHPAIRFAAAHDYDGFAEQELLDRRALRWPPYVRLAYLGVIGRERDGVAAAAERYAALLREDPRWEVLGPAPYPVARVNDEWRYRVAVKTRDAAALRAALRATVLPAADDDGATRLAVNVDP